MSHSKCLRMILKNTKNLVMYIVNHSDLFLSQMLCMNTLILTLIFNLLDLFHWKLNETFSVQLFNRTPGQEYRFFPYWTRNKRSLFWFIFPSFIIMLAFCSFWLTCPHVNDLILLKNSSKKSKKHSRLASS